MDQCPKRELFFRPFIFNGGRKALAFGLGRTGQRLLCKHFYDLVDQREVRIHRVSVCPFIEARFVGVFLLAKPEPEFVLAIRDGVHALLKLCDLPLALNFVGIKRQRLFSFASRPPAPLWFHSVIVFRLLINFDWSLLYLCLRLYKDGSLFGCFDCILGFATPLLLAVARQLRDGCTYVWTFSLLWLDDDCFLLNICFFFNCIVICHFLIKLDDALHTTTITDARSMICNLFSLKWLHSLDEACCLRWTSCLFALQGWQWHSLIHRIQKLIFVRRCGVVKVERYADVVGFDRAWFGSARGHYVTIKAHRWWKVTQDRYQL